MKASRSYAKRNLPGQTGTAGQQAREVPPPLQKGSHVICARVMDPNERRGVRSRQDTKPPKRVSTRHEPLSRAGKGSGHGRPLIPIAGVS